MKPDFERFARLYVRRKLAAAGVAPSDSELDQLVRVVREVLPGEHEPEGHTPPSEMGEETQTLTRHSILFRRGDITVELNANTGDPMAWLCAALAEGNTPLPPAEALRLAEAAAKPPATAVLVQQDYEDMGGKPVFVAHWEHREDGVLVEHDYIRVLVGGHSGRVYAVQRRWHDVDPNPTER